MATIKEKARAHAEGVFEKALKAPWPEAKQMFADTYIAGAAEALSGQWHDADKEKPKIGQNVLWHYRTKMPIGGTWIDCFMDDSYDGEYQPKNACHWMAIPDLPNRNQK